MTTLAAGAAMAIGWFPTSVGGIVLSMFLLLVVSWWVTGRFFKERDLTTGIFRGLLSVLVSFGIAYFHYSSVRMLREGPLAKVVLTKEEKEAPLRANMQQWVAPAAYDAYWTPPAVDPRNAGKMSPKERRDFEAWQAGRDVLVESALRGLTWMALEHKNPSPFGRSSKPHTERGTKALNSFTAAQTQAMFDFIVAVKPALERDARPCLADALAFCHDTAAAASPAAAPGQPPAAPGQPAANPAEVQYPFVVVTRETDRGRSFVVRISATQTRVIEAATEEEALKIAKGR